MGCPECDAKNAKKDPRWILRALCPKHLAEVEPIPEEKIRAAFEEGLRARRACIEAHVVPWIDPGLRFR